MLLIDRPSAEIWQMLLPKRNILFPAYNEWEDLIFTYRNYLYFVHEDGAVVRMNKPKNVHLLTQEDLWELLFHEKETTDYDDLGIFSIGGILLHIGYLVEVSCKRLKNFKLEFVNTIGGKNDVFITELQHVSFQYALYYGLVECHRKNVASDGEIQLEVQQIDEIEEPLEVFQS